MKPQMLMTRLFFFFLGLFAVIECFFVAR